MEVKEEIERLKKNNVPVYSISRLNTFDNCKYEYYLGYMAQNVPRENIYGFTGTSIHSCLEKLQNGKNLDFEQEIKNTLNQAEFLGLHFPSPKTQEKWEKDIFSFAKSYEPIKGKETLTENQFLINIKGHYLQGFIDLIIRNNDNTISIIDYKTSTKYSNSELQEKGRQLILYAIAMEMNGEKIKDIGWNFLKYVNISYKLKNGKTKTITAERGYAVEKLKSDILKELKVDLDLETEILIEQAVQENSFDKLPNKIKEKYTFSDCIIYYDYSEQNKKETIDFIIKKIEEIEKYAEDEDWQPKEITPYNSFYCKNLCAYAKNCEYLQQFLNREQRFNEIKENKELENELQKFI